MRRDHLEKVEKWKRRIEEIHREVTNLTLQRDIWNELGDMIKANPAIQRPSVFYDWLLTLYPHTQASAIRRIAEVAARDDPISLGNLLMDMASCAEIVAQYAVKTPLINESVVLDDDNPLDNIPFTIRIDKEIPNVAADLDRLTRVAEPVKTYVDKRIAHLDQGRHRHTLRFREIDEATDVLQELAIRYYAFLTGVHYEVHPTIAYDWQAIFEVPWIRDTEQEPEP